MAKRKSKITVAPQPGWAIYLRVSDEESQNPDASKERQRYFIRKSLIEHSDMLLVSEYADILTGRSPQRKNYQRLLADARMGKFSHVAVERADRFGRNDTEALRAIDELHELGIAVRFANQPDLDPVAPDDRIIVALWFSLARRESMMTAMRIRDAGKVKRENGGYLGRVPDGYVSVEDHQPHRKSYMRKTHHIEKDPQRSPIWRLAWDLLLTDKMTLADICEELHARGHHYRTGRPFITVHADGKRIANYSTLSHIFHNWTYAGWIVNEENGYLPKTLRGTWEAIVTTEEFERGLAILGRRHLHRVVRRKHDYLLKGLIYYTVPERNAMSKLTGSTSNTKRSNGGTAYYCVPRSSINFPCNDIDAQVAEQITSIHVDPKNAACNPQRFHERTCRKTGHAEAERTC